MEDLRARSEALLRQTDGPVIVGIDGERMRLGGAEGYSRIDRVAVIPWRSPYESEEEEMEALSGLLDESGGPYAVKHAPDARDDREEGQS